MHTPHWLCFTRPAQCSRRGAGLWKEPAEGTYHFPPHPTPSSRVSSRCVPIVRFPPSVAALAHPSRLSSALTTCAVAHGAACRAAQSEEALRARGHPTTSALTPVAPRAHAHTHAHTHAHAHAYTHAHTRATRRCLFVCARAWSSGYVRGGASRGGGVEAMVKAPLPGSVQRGGRGGVACNHPSHTCTRMRTRVTTPPP